MTDIWLPVALVPSGVVGLVAVIWGIRMRRCWIAAIEQAEGFVDASQDARMELLDALEAQEKAAAERFEATISEMEEELAQKVSLILQHDKKLTWLYVYPIHVVKLDRWFCVEQKSKRQDREEFDRNLDEAAGIEETKEEVPDGPEDAGDARSAGGGDGCG